MMSLQCAAGAGLAGANLQATLQNPWVLGAFGLIFVALALAMFGFYELQLPAALRNRLNSASQGQRGGTLGGAATMGVTDTSATSRPGHIVGAHSSTPLRGAVRRVLRLNNRQ